MTSEDTKHWLVELYMLVVKGVSAYDGTSDPLVPKAPAAHYDALARAIVTFARSHPDPEFVVEHLADQLPFIEAFAIMRSWNVRKGQPAEPPAGATPEEAVVIHTSKEWLS